jgi:hypothetical protein
MPFSVDVDYGNRRHRNIKFIATMMTKLTSGCDENSETRSAKIVTCKIWEFVKHGT